MTTPTDFYYDSVMYDPDSAIGADLADSAQTAELPLLAKDGDIRRYIRRTARCDQGKSEHVATIEAFPPATTA
jgi:hypothetical protein